MALSLEEIDSFKSIHSESPKEIEKFINLLDVVIVNLNRTAELQDGMMCMILQQKLPASMLANYHRWLFENHKVEVLREYIVQEAEFHTTALETVQGLSAGRSSEFDTRVMKESPRTFLGRSCFKSEAGSVQRFCEMSHSVWACEEFKKLDIPKRWENAMKFKLRFRCLGRDYLGQHCTRTRVCDLGGCRELHHRLLHKDQTYFPGGKAKLVVKPKQ